MDDFIVLKPASGNTDEEIKARLPKVRDYHSEILKRTTTTTATTATALQDEKRRIDN